MARIETTTLACGMPVLIERIEGVRSAAMTWLVPVGSAHDPIDRLGASALLGELLGRGAGDRDSRAWADAVDRLGVSDSIEHATFYMRLSASMVGECLGEALPLFVDVVLRPRLDESAIEPAKDLAQQSLASLADEPTERAMLGARARHFAPPLDRSGYGTEEGIHACSRDGLASHWSGRARPRGSILALAGDVDPTGVVGRLNELLGGWSGGASEADIGTEAPRGYAHEADDSSQVQIVVMHDAPVDAHPDAMLERIVSSVLSGGMSGRLFTEVREKRGLCYSVSSSYQAGKEQGSVTGYVGTTPERAQESLDVLWSELERIGTPAGRVTQEEFERAVVGLKSRVVFAGESTAGRAAALASDYHKLGRARSLEDWTRELDEVTLERVNEYLGRRRMGRVTIQTLGPKELRAPAGV
ncbi:MAG: pitrilysin family protein [Phycisphaerales bacterium]|jgi:predicted Zn-dependent peptidase|nr:pitrilysin family protein [Phycisphaerales bacterium]